MSLSPLALFIDFDDSFSYNIIQLFHEENYRIKVIHWMDWEGDIEADLLILGPGPGHPEDYQRIFPWIKKWLSSHRPLFGVCLGHQLFWHILGVEIKRSQFPLHGQKITLHLTEDWKNYLGLSTFPNVQRYNSLAVHEALLPAKSPYLNYSQNGEVLITRSDHVLTYQFHPESVGTTFRKSFIRAVKCIMA